MLYLKKGDSKRVWYIGEKNDKDMPVYLWELNLVSSSLTNKFEVVESFFNELAELIPDFSDWFSDILYRYITSEYDSSILLNEKEKFYEYSKRYIEEKKIDFSKFVNEKKKSKTSILVMSDELKELAITSAALKLLGIFSNDVKLRLTRNSYRTIYNYMILNCYTKGVVDKIFKIIKSRTYTSYMSDKFIWDLANIKTNETPESATMTVFVYLLDNLIVILDSNVNPIPFIIKVSDLSVRWIMKPFYKNQTIYGEVYGGMDDIYGIPYGQQAFNVYANNDTIYKGSDIGMSIIDSMLSEDEFDAFRDRLDKIDIIFPYLKILSLPIISRVLEIPYRQLLSTPPKHIILLGVFIKELAKDNLKTMFPFLYELITAVPRDSENFLNQYVSTSLNDNLDKNNILNKRRNKNTIYITATKSSYKIREIQLFLNTKNTIYGFTSNVIQYKIFSSICGVISASKKGLISIINGYPIPKITKTKLESEIINFYSPLYSGKLDNLFQELTKKADEEYF